MQVCARCLYSSNHPFGIIFDEDGICSGCRVHEEKDTLNWELRELKLSKILNIFKKSSKKNYDCIIPISGGKDSYFIVDLIKNKYHMNPLLVSYNTHYNTLIGIRNLQNLKTKFDCDLIQLNINPNITKRIARYTFQKFGSVYWHNHAGHTVFPVQIAVKMKIPLIIWGLHQGLDQVGMFSHLNEVEMTRKYRKEHDLMGFEPEDLVDQNDCPETIKKELKKYFYPSDLEIKNIQVRGIYLNNYIRWDSKAQHEDMIREYDYRTIQQIRTFNHYEDCHSLVYNDIHDYIKYMKLGYSKVLDHAVQEIRLRRISRAAALELVKIYSKKEVRTLNLFLDYLNVSDEEFNKVVKNFENLRVTMEDYEIDASEIIKSALNLISDSNQTFIVNDISEENPKMHSFYKGIY